MRTPDSAASRASDVDHQLLTALRQCGADPRVAHAARTLSRSGEHGALWLAAGLAGACADRARRRAWLRATALVGAAHVASMGVKRVVRRPRPRLLGAEPLVRTAGRHRFPSSHATSAAAAAVAFGVLLPSGPLRSFSPFPPLAAVMCVSRLAVGVHYPSDVAAGAVLGAVTARLGRAWSLRAPRGGVDD
ncbi:phosphatase PAP2 family protein [Streptomyces sp. H10-C2]|uniref:phosphatase PAP2 family protein n=1 Tax=unclassified Streptomyces TaxID=2593676 RepID=UPI0024B8831C|nr:MULTISPECIES: phosphatase PAP2 family protein [unclassified Streptomyces]MDJ0340535.1 phosphatase PAP2 family protein [Streptomyces sp. PH10-H1]MDJ0370183.1 phosphatase PAP2 family protein [Streptomyces sp. H10-C2]